MRFNFLEVLDVYNLRIFPDILIDFVPNTCETHQSGKTTKQAKPTKHTWREHHDVERFSISSDWKTAQSWKQLVFLIISLSTTITLIMYFF